MKDLKLERKLGFFFMVVIIYLEIRFLKCKKHTLDNRKIGAT
jgi:hypothetical protein